MRACTVVAHSMELDELLFSSFFMDHGNNNELKETSRNFESKFDCGYIQIDLETVEKEYQINFNHSFSKSPVITLSFARSGYIASTHIGIIPGKSSGDGFTLMAVSSSVQYNKTIEVYWIAMEP